jgi:hypothetical protein
MTNFPQNSGRRKQIIGVNWEFLPILYLDVMRLIWTVDFSGNSGIIIIVKGEKAEGHRDIKTSNDDGAHLKKHFSP